MDLEEMIGTLVNLHIDTSTEEVMERIEKYDNALRTARTLGKPLLVVGRPKGLGFHGCGDVCVDLDKCNKCGPNCVKAVQANVQDLHMFHRKQFGAAFASHVLEHVDDLKVALRELRRVSDHLYIAGPRLYGPYHYVNVLKGDHRRHVKDWRRYEF